MEGGDTAMNHSSPAISLVSRRVMASPVSVPVSRTAPRPSPGSVPAGAATKMVFPSRKNRTMKNGQKFKQGWE